MFLLVVMQLNKELHLHPDFVGRPQTCQVQFLSQLDLLYFFLNLHFVVGTAVAQWLRCCATNRKVAGSISAGVIGIDIFIDIKSF